MTLPFRGDTSTHYGAGTAIAVVIANMIGTGVFTSLGFQLLGFQSGFPLLMLWVIGGLAAFCGALTYAELGASLPRSGGEYNFLARIYHPGAGFVSGWISATTGFAAPTALAAITFGTYLASVIPGAPQGLPTALACALVITLTVVHSTTRQSSGGVQRWFTLVKVGFILLFCGLAWLLAREPQPLPFTPVAGDGALIFGGAFAVSLIYVNYAYTGWNAATYLSGELDRPQRNLPWVLAGGTLVVMLLYVALNVTFLHVAPVAALTGQLEVGVIAARHVFGPVGTAVMGGSLALLLISTASAMTIAGPRVLQVIGQDFPVFGLLARENRHGVPVVAIFAQGGLALVFIVTASFESILVFAGFTLGLNTLVTVLGIFVLRWRQPHLARPFRVPFYPLPPLVYLAITGWTLVYLLRSQAFEALAGIGIVLAGVVFYLGVRLLAGAAAAPDTAGENRSASHSETSV